MAKKTFTELLEDNDEIRRGIADILDDRIKKATNYMLAVSKELDYVKAVVTYKTLIQVRQDLLQIKEETNGDK